MNNVGKSLCYLNKHSDKTVKSIERLVEEHRVKLVQEKWECLGFLDGLRGHVKENVALLFESQQSIDLSEVARKMNNI